MWWLPATGYTSDMGVMRDSVDVAEVETVAMSLPNNAAAPGEAGHA
jgi:hypothetical protein